MEIGGNDLSAKGLEDGVESIYTLYTQGIPSLSAD